MDIFSEVSLRSVWCVSSPQGNYSLVKGLIYYKGHVWVGRNASLHSDILLDLHLGAIAGHSGFHATYHQVKHLFAWPRLKRNVKQFVASCSVFQEEKSELVAYPGLLEPLKIPAGMWQVVTMGFINGLPKSLGYDCMMVVVDSFFRFVHFVPLKHPFTTLSVPMHGIC
jgi:hypothetical protein